ncbi:MAG: peptidyl-prolyl cis-trans isomerase [Deltaproteobacteria bacterium]|nr:peptidyl-prolyl cis-trans isomerase [Deltaproteobacteria bacterium]
MKKLMVVIAVLIFICSCSSERAENTIALFEGGNITKEDLVAHYKKLKMESRYRNNPEQLTPAFVFDHALNMEIIIAKGLKENLHLDPWIRQEIHGFMSDLFLKVMQDRLVPEIDKENITEEEMRQFYEEHKKNYLKKALYGIKMIKINDKEKAESIVSEIREGRITFEDAASNYSTDGKSKGNDGFIGTRSLDKFRDNWRLAIENLRLNAMSDPVKIDEDYYIFKLIKKSESCQYTYEEKSAYIKNDVLYDKYRKEWEKTYDGLKEEFEVKIDEERLREFCIEGLGTMNRKKFS